MKAWIPMVLLTVASGCSVLVDDAIRDREDGGIVGMDAPTDAPDGGMTTDDVCADFPDGTRCSIEGIAEDFVCVGGRCELSACGDGILDDRSEECDDGNDAVGDGCEPATCDYTCDTSVDCDDELSCNGAETCSDAHVCVQGTPAADGAGCGAGGVCLDGACIPAGCNNGALEAGEECDPMITTDGSCQVNCTWLCETDEECAAMDTDVCDGVSTCNVATHLCVPSEPLVCPDADSDPCTIDSCDPVRGCVVDATANDADADGHYAEACGGDDCDDTNAMIHAGLGEICGDGLDNDCSGTPDDNTPVWYVDCDADGFAASTTGSMTSCTRPTAPPASCPASPIGAWVSRTPTGSAIDCHDRNSVVRPGQRGFFETAYTRITGGTSFDYDCSGRLEAHYPFLPARPGTCSGLRTECDGPRYFPEDARCGTSSAFSRCIWNIGAPPGCLRRTSTTTETVRCH